MLSERKEGEGEMLFVQKGVESEMLRCQILVTHFSHSVFELMD